MHFGIITNMVRRVRREVVEQLVEHLLTRLALAAVFGGQALDWLARRLSVIIFTADLICVPGALLDAIVADLELQLHLRCICNSGRG